MRIEQQSEPSERQPVFTLPPVVLGLIAVIVAVHVATTFVLDIEGQSQLALWFAFIPLRLTTEVAVPGGWLPLLWTPITHAFMHAGWEHLLINSAWLAIFGTPVARRYGPAPFLIIFFVSAIAGAFAFVVASSPGLHILVGASGGISGLTGAAMRFVFQPVELARHPETGEVMVLGRRLASFRDLWRNSRARTFTLIWIILNGVAPLLPIFTPSVQIEIAWQAHLGGFFAGLLIVPLFERRPQALPQE